MTWTAILDLLGGIGGVVAALSSALLAIVTGLLMLERSKRKDAEDYRIAKWRGWRT